MGWPGASSRRRLLGAAFGVWLGTAAAGSGPVSGPATEPMSEPMLARVLAVTPDRVTLSLEGPDRGAATRVEVPVAAVDRPAGIEPGRLIRVWPGPRGLGAGARLVPLGTDADGTDRTGVRARLMHGAGRGFGGGRGGR